MVNLDVSKGQLAIIIPNTGIQNLVKYQRAILKVLGKIKIEKCDPEFKEHLKTVYELLSHLQPDEKFLAQYKELLKEENEKLNQMMVS